MFLKSLKAPLYYFQKIRKTYRDKHTIKYVENRFVNWNSRNISDFNYSKIKRDVLNFVDSNKSDGSDVKFLYSNSCKQPTLYASAYACMIYSIYGEILKLNEKKEKEWVDYFDSFQNKDDGLFYDPVIRNDIYKNTDWWGARHLALHMISAYTDLGARPKHPLRFIKQYYDTTFLKAWLEQTDWNNDAFSYENDVDNKIMNICCLLQYQRDNYVDKEAGKAVEYIKQYLKEKINQKTGMWGNYDVSDPRDLSRMVQFAYHLFPIFFYDDDFDFNHDRIIDLVLQTQNKFGGFGVPLNSSACEDIDSIDILIRFAPYVDEQRKMQIDSSLNKAHKWVLINQVDDGGFVFRLNESMVFGDSALSVNANKGAMLSTWFRTLSLAYLSSYFKSDDVFTITKCPGYEFK